MISAIDLHARKIVSVTRFGNTPPAPTPTPEQIHKEMKRAIELSDVNTTVEKGRDPKGGGPFGAVVFKIVDGQVVKLGEGHNRVTLDNDPTAHGEVTAIRNAAKEYGFDGLKGAYLATSTLTCPMCYSAAYWAGIAKVYYANTAEEVPVFDDAPLWAEIQNPAAVAQKTEQITDKALLSKAQQAYQHWEERMKAGNIQNYNPGS